MIWKDDAGKTHNTLGENIVRSLELLIILRKRRYKYVSVNVNPHFLEFYYRSLSEGNNKIIIKFSRRKDAESVLRNRKILKHFDPRSIEIDSVRVQVKVYANATSLSVANTKNFDPRKRLNHSG